MNSQVPVTIVMIEDDEGHARLIERNIRRSGINIRHRSVRQRSGRRSITSWAVKGKCGLEKGKSYLVLLDLNLPDMSGVDILKRLKEARTTERIPVVVLTTTDDKSEIQRCYDLGCNVYVTKPVNYENFADAIRQLGLFFTVVKVPEVG